MSKTRQQYPYQKGTSIFIQPETLNLLAQLKLPGQTWSGCIENIVRTWAGDRGLIFYDNPNLMTVMTIRHQISAAEDAAKEKE